MTNPPLIIRNIDPTAWPGISDAFEDTSYEQSLTYGQAAAVRIGGEARFVAVETTKGEPVAAACLRIKRIPGLGRGIAWIAAGPMTRPRTQPDLSPDRLCDILLVLRREIHAAGHILRLRLPAVAGYDPDKITPLTAAAGFTPTNRAPSYRTVIVDLEPDEDTLMRGLHGKWRNPLRNALKAGLSLDYGPIGTFSDRFHSLYERVRRAKGFNPEIPPDFYYDLTGPDFEHEVLIARVDGADVAGITIGRTGTNAVYLFGATDEPGRRMNAGYFLMWHAILRGRAAGVRRLDLGGIDEEANPTVTRFKLRTGGQDITAPGPWEARPPGAATLLIDLAETLHGKLSDRT